MENSIGKNFNFKSLIKYSLPTIAMFIFMSLYTIVDAFFIANYVGSNGVAAINIAYPFYQLVAGISLMFGAGGSALLAKKMGEKKHDEVHGDFTFIIVVAEIIGFIIMVFGFIFIDELIHFLGATEILYDLVYTYVLVTIIFIPIIMFKGIANQLLMSAGQPKLGLHCSVIGGVLNVIFDYLFIVVFNLGMVGAALGSYLAMAFSIIICINYYRNPESNIHFAKIRTDFHVIIKSMSNGSSEMLSQISVGITTLLFNYILIKLAGESGVSAISIILYIQFIMLAIFLGYSIGITPIIAYNYGAKNHAQLKKLFKYCMIFISLVSLVVLVFAFCANDFIVSLFIKDDPDSFKLTSHGLFLFSFSYLFNGFNIFNSSFFTGLNNGKISAFLSFFRNLFLVVIALLVLPQFLGIDGVWLAIPLSEAVSFVIGIIVLLLNKKRYGY